LRQHILHKGELVSPEADGAEERYSTNPEFLQQAFAHYCQGCSLAKIAVLLRPEWPTVNESTLRRVAKEHGWAEARAEYLMLYAKAFAKAENILPTIILDLLTQKAKLQARAMNAAEFFAFNQICENLLIYTGKHPKLKDGSALAVSTDAEAQALFDVLREDEVIGPAWKKRRAKIQQAYNARLAVLKGKKK